ncbi:MAG: ABC transporter ATP-binding protein [Sneathiella sp.]
MKMDSQMVMDFAQVSKTYGKVKALEDITLNLAKGSSVALVGHNGAGKSTLIKLILGLIKPSSGRVRVFRQEPTSGAFNPLRCKIGYLPEQCLFQKSLTGRETLIFYAQLKGLKAGKFNDSLERVDLAAAADRKVGTYSKGMRQRLGVAQALLGAPELLVLDEPTSGLDPIARQNIYKIIGEEKERGASVLISSHVLTELDDRIDQVAILNKGKLTAMGTIPILRRKVKMKSEIILSAPKLVIEQIEKSVGTPRDCTRKRDGVLSISCDPENKIAILEKIMVFGAGIENIEIQEPSLELVYNAYSNSNIGGAQDV